MTYERAREILDPEHREQYESIEVVNEACRMGMKAIDRLIPKPVKLSTKNAPKCPRCKREEGVFGWTGVTSEYCCVCGQSLDWSELREEQP